MRAYVDTKRWHSNPLLKTDARYLFKYLYGSLLEDDLHNLEDFLCAHLFPYRKNLPYPFFAPKRKYVCPCTANYHLESTVEMILYHYEKKSTRHEVPKFTDFPEMSANQYCRRTRYAYYSIDGRDNIVTSYLPRNEIDLENPDPENCYPYQGLPKLNDYYYHSQYRNDV